MKRLITQALIKRTVSAALAETKARRDWTNADLADALGCCPNTVTNRLDAETSGNPLTINELLHSVQYDGTYIANRVFGLVGYRLAPLPEAEGTCDRRKASSITRAGAAVSEMLEDGEITEEEIRENRAALEDALYGIKELLGRVGPRAVAG